MQPVRRPAVDPDFGLNLWLSVPFRGQLFWAYNSAHLCFIRDFVAADLRQRQPNRNSSLVSRLPGWVKSAKNRSAILSVIDALEDRAKDS